MKVMTVSERVVRNAMHPGQQSVNLSMGTKDMHFYSSFSRPWVSSYMFLWFSAESWTPGHLTVSQMWPPGSSFCRVKWVD